MAKDKCCCDKLPSYPRNWPKIYFIHLILSNINRIVSLSADLGLLYLAVQFNPYFFDFNEYPNGKSETWDRNPWFLFTVKQGETARFMFTVIPGYIVAFFIVYVYYLYRKNKDKPIPCCSLYFGCFVLISIILGAILLIVVGTLYKAGLIIYCIYNFKNIKNVIKQEKISIDMQEYFRTFRYIFLCEALISSYWLWIIALVNLQETLDNLDGWTSIDNYSWQTWLDIVKIISTGTYLIYSSTYYGLFVLFLFPLRN